MAKTMDKKSRKGALDRKMDQSYQPDLHEQEKNYDATNGMDDGKGGDSAPPQQMDGGDEAGQEGSTMDQLNDIGESLSQLAAKLPKDKQALAAQALTALAQIVQGGAENNPLPKDGEANSDAQGGQPVMNQSM